MPANETLQLPRGIAQITCHGFDPKARAELISRLPIREGGELTDELLESARAVAKTFDAETEIQVSKARTLAEYKEAYRTLPPPLRERIKPPACDNGVNVGIYSPAGLPRRIWIEGADQARMLIEKVAPEYSRAAQEAVTLQVIVGRDGAVVEVTPLAGPESLIEPAVAAVKRWKYRPTTINGFPVEVQTTVEVSPSES